MRPQVRRATSRADVRPGTAAAHGGELGCRGGSGPVLGGDTAHAHLASDFRTVLGLTPGDYRRRHDGAR